MKANELRVGNWIHTNKFEQVIDVMCDSINTAEKEGVPYEDIAPIPLTEEWLVKFGFSLHGGDYGWVYYPDKCNYSLIYKDEENFYCRVSGSGDSRLPKIEHVHHLQNLIYALTGKEITIKNT